MIQNNVYSDPATIFKSSHLRQNYEETFLHRYFSVLEKRCFKNTKYILNSKRTVSNIS